MSRSRAENRSGLGLTVGRQMGGLPPHPDGRRLATTDFKVNLEVWVMENFLPAD